ncbi:MAG: anti-sigma factor family protein [Nitrospinota bacterium]
MNYEEFKKSIDLYLDGELDASSALKFQELADTDPKCRDLLEREESFRLRVREELAKESAPELLRARIQRDIRRHDLRQAMGQFGGWRAAAAVLLAIFIGGAVYFQYDRRDLTRLVRSSVKSHRLYAQAADQPEFWADNERALLPLIQRRVQFEVAFPSLAQEDIQMVGGRISLLVDRKSALTFYRRGNNRLSLFTMDYRGIRLPRWGGKEIKGRMVYFLESGDHRVAVWKDGACVYSFVAQLNEGDMGKYLATSFREIVRSQGS